MLFGFISFRSTTSYLIAYDVESKQNTEQEDMIKTWKLHNSMSRTFLRRKRLIIPIYDALANVKQQSEEAATHWSLLICDIQLQADESVKAQFRHFDSIACSTNIESAQLVAETLHKVGIVLVLLHVCYYIC